jgi:hypothetical protein
MMAVAERFEDLKAVAQPTNWRGRSGRFYALAALPVGQFSLDGDDLYMLASGRRVLWVGGAAEVIGEAASRAHFRLALRNADSAFRVSSPANATERMTIAWDLDGAEPVFGLSLA